MKIKDFGTATKIGIAEVKAKIAEVKAEIAALESRLTKLMQGGILALFALLCGIVTLA